MRTLTAMLPNAADGRWTRHVFVEDRPLVTPAGSVTGYEQIYRCDATGSERRWGVTAQRLPDGD
jgi:hypothetical protein